MRCLTSCWWKLSLLLAFALSTGTSARAEEALQAPAGRASLIWRRGPGAENCISSEQLEKALERQLGYPAFEREGQLLVEGAVVRAESPARFRAEVELRESAGRCARAARGGSTR